MRPNHYGSQLEGPGPKAMFENFTVAQQQELAAAQQERFIKELEFLSRLTLLGIFMFFIFIVGVECGRRHERGKVTQLEARP